jgi:ubiquinone/menaquinone biosynthesis C-methylase UbiE
MASHARPAGVMLFVQAETTTVQRERPMLQVLERSSPDGHRSIELYRAVADRYDRRTAFAEPFRRHAVERLAPAEGEVVLDVGCGTGLNFAGLIERVGAEGRLVGIDHSPEMLERARERVREQGWGNVTLLEAPAEHAEPAVEVDAALLCATHDILRSPPALKNVLRHVKDGGRIVAAGPKWAPWWRPDAASLDLCTWQINQDYVTTFEGFGRPCSHLAELVPDLEVEEMFFGAGYLAAGTR